jgi:ATP-binding cassette, subfamily B, multidrug efflux pump
MPETSAKRQPDTPLLPFGPGGRRGVVDPGPKPKNTAATLRRLWGYLRRQRFDLILVFGLVTVSTALNLANPYLLGQVIDRAVLKGDVGLVGQYALIMIAVYLVGSLSTGLQTYVMARVAQHTVRDLRADLFGRMQSLPLSYFDKTPHGELMSRLTNDIDNISTVLTDGVTQFISSILTLVGVVVIMLLLNPWLALVSMVAVPTMTLITRAISKFTLKGFRDQQKALGVLNGTIEETITGERVVKAYGQEKRVVEQFKVENRTLREAAIRAQTFSGLMGPFSNMIGNTSFAIVAGAGGWMALNGIATVGEIAAFLNYSRQLGMPLNQLANLYNAIQSALAGAERVFDLLDQQPEPADAPDAVALGTVAGDVLFDGVSFGYDEDQTVLEQVSLHARSGQTIALVGPTGAGKTTIINLLSRFYDIRAGAICVDGHDIRELKRDELRRLLGIVLQDTFLFSDTVMQNIRYGRLDASDEEVIAAARLANADHFIHHLPQGYATQLSERGSNLSQGQRQLLAIARAILADPSILILDEATSSVDTRTETHIQEAMLRLMEGRTSFVIAHRLSTIRGADEILVIDHGRIIERGTHPELLAQKGFYQRLYASQFRGQAQII